MQTKTGPAPRPEPFRHATPAPRPEPFRHATPATVEALLDRLTALEVLLRTVAVKISADRADLEMLRCEVEAQRAIT